MENQNWYEMGAKIGDLVQSAIDNNDFKQLNKSISDTINYTMETVQKSMKEAGIYGRGGQPQTTWREGESAFEQARRKGTTSRFSQEKGVNWSGAESRTYGAEASENIKFGDARKNSGNTIRFEDMNARKNYGKAARFGDMDIRKNSGSTTRFGDEEFSKGIGSYKGLAFMGVGYSFMGIFAAAAIGLALLGMLFWRPLLGAAAVFGILSAGFLVMGLKGSGQRAQVKRQRRYLQIMGERDTCTLEELAAGTGKSKSFVAKDLREMIQKHMFPGGAFLDAQETCLMTSRKAYRQYQETMERYEQQKAAKKHQEVKGEQAEKANSQGKGKLSGEVSALVEEGKEFIIHIHECNVAIVEAEMSEKLDRLENVVTRIFERVEDKPENAPDLRKMMSYYLPITRKLVDAYRDLDAQKLEGQNISRTKKEIRDSLDTINTAFETLLDSFFQETAWDISSDISVLHTMMAQDGLMKKDFVQEGTKASQ